MPIMSLLSNSAAVLPTEVTPLWTLIGIWSLVFLDSFITQVPSYTGAVVLPSFKSHISFESLLIDRLSSSTPFCSLQFICWRIWPFDPEVPTAWILLIDTLGGVQGVPLYFLQVGSWIQRVDQTQFSPFGETIGGVVLFHQETHKVSLWLLCVVNSCCWTMPSSIHSLGL